MYDPIDKNNPNVRTWRDTWRNVVLTIHRQPGTVELKGTYPPIGQSIEEHVNQRARLSTNSASSNPKLIERLIRDAHTSPLEFCEFDYTITCPLFVAVHLLRHRTANFSMQSARYTEVLPEFYVPDHVPYGRDENNRQAPVERTAIVPTLEVELLQTYCELWSKYQRLLDFGVSLEFARSVLPQSVMVKLAMKMDGNNLMKFLKLRTAPDAQWETQYIANRMEAAFACAAPHMYRYYVEHVAYALTLSGSEAWAVLNQDRSELDDKSVQRLKKKIATYMEVACWDEKPSGLAFLDAPVVEEPREWTIPNEH